MTDREFMSSTPECGGDAAAYALGALEPHEAEAFRLHIQDCAVCRDEVQALTGVVQALPMAAHQYEAPRDLKRRVMKEVRGEPMVARGGAARRSRLWQAPRQLVAGLGATVLAAGGAVAAIELTAGTAATVITAQVSGVTGAAQLRVSNQHAELVVRHLTGPGRGHEYEVWLQSGKAAPVPAHVLFGTNASGYADVGIPGRLHGVTRVMVTKEPLGGSRHPTQQPVIVARLA
jgi:anti-sigma-K factor RskA